MTTEIQNAQKATLLPSAESASASVKSSFTEKVSQFFAPFCPLWQALVVFFKTGVGILLGIVLILAMFFNLLCDRGGYRNGPRPPHTHQRQETSQSMPQRLMMQDTPQIQGQNFDRGGMQRGR